MNTELFEHRSISQSRQGCWQVRRTFTHNGHKLRVTIYRDSYEFQSHAYLELFSARDLKWNRVHELPTEDWYKDLNVLFIEKDMTSTHLATIGRLCNQLVAAGEDLLEGIDA